MPIIEYSDYTAPRWLPGGHAQTIFPSLFRRAPDLPFVRSRLATPDNDCILLDSVRAAATRSEAALVLSHGLEGDSRRKYIRGLAQACLKLGIDCLSRNFRACGGEMNRAPGMYHSGQTDDLHLVVEHCLALGYRRVFLAGYSMGGNQVLKYLGENPGRVPPEVTGAAVFSVPCDLPGSAKVLDLPENAIYMRYFLRTLRQKVRAKHADYPDLYPLDGLEAMRTFAEFDNAYTAPVHGFASAADYWEKASSLPHLVNIRVPVLLVNARNDPFLSPGCFPLAAAVASPYLFLETPLQGGHVGFPGADRQGLYWSDRRGAAFFRDLLPATRP